ncbi:hypothetical protein K0A97_00150 [Patescibacteria group bacterium]|nr:hypothetical protein [Patescibacteria group bacterium]
MSIYHPEISESFAIEFPRRNNHNFESKKQILEREFDHSRNKVVIGRQIPYRVASPEDLIVPKLVRVINSLERFPELNKILPRELKSLSDEEVKLKLKKVNSLRREAMISPGDVGLAGELRFLSDLYDIWVLSRVTGYHEDYFKQVEGDWISINSKPELKRKIYEVIIP